MSRSTLEVVTALKVLSEVSLTIRQFAELMAKAEVTEADVDAALNRTDDTIAEARDSD